MWVYLKYEEVDRLINKPYFVGFFDPNNKFHIESEHKDNRSAARRCAWLNGSSVRSVDDLIRRSDDLK